MSSIAFCPLWLDISKFLFFQGVSAVCIDCKIVLPPCVCEQPIALGMSTWLGEKQRK